MHEWMASDPQNVVVVHCKVDGREWKGMEGKGREGKRRERKEKRSS
jgi:hypothetical protein